MPEPMNESTLSLNPVAVANVALMLTTHLMAFLLRGGRLSPTEVQEIFQTTRARYMSNPQERPSNEWQAQTAAILTMIHGDVVHFAQKPA
jgi:hypothetical protein